MSVFRMSGVILLSTFLVIFSTKSWAPPPVRFPQACAPDFCVEVIPTSPYSPHVFKSISNFDDGTSTLVIELTGGAVIAFHSKSFKGADVKRVLLSPKWRVGRKAAVASGCLVCEANEYGYVKVIGIAATQPQDSRAMELVKGSDICYWALDMESAGYGSGRKINLGKKVCIQN